MDLTPKQTLSVSDITAEIKELLELHLPAVWVQGELSNFTHHHSGHMYFSLKDSRSQINCVMWRSRTAGLFFTPQDGMRVNVYGSVRVYEKRGTYQIDVTRMVPAGIGDLQLAFEALKNKLSQEGLFDEQFKKDIPKFPEKIGIVTSQTGAAIRDVLHVLNRRFPSAIKVIRPALVQGDGAAQDIAEAIADFNAYGNVDVIIVTRGGGSLEDLWAFNEEIVARAVFASEIPIVSAVGHEVDFTICDFVADLRAPTPSAAAEIVVPDQQELQDALVSLHNRTRRATELTIKENRETLQRIVSSYAFRRPQDVVRQYQQRVDDLLSRITNSSRHILTLKGQLFHQVSHQIKNMHPNEILKRGYAVVRDSGSHKVLRKIEQVGLNDSIDVLLHNGSLQASVVERKSGTTVDTFVKKDQNE